jgi:hypothetical protein
MENIVKLHVNSQEQFDALKAFAKALKIKFEISKEDENYNPEFVEKILQGDKDIADGKGKKVTLDELNKLWK